MSLRASDGREMWERQPAKRPRAENGMENGLHEHGLLDRGAGSERDRDRRSDRGKMKTYSKKSHQ
ncbi:fibrosin-1-like protein, partial [Arapaima gigas]